MTETLTVRLLRGRKEAVEFPAENAKRARQRANSLMSLHSCNSHQNGDVITVDASAFYDGK